MQAFEQIMSEIDDFDKEKKELEARVEALELKIKQLYEKAERLTEEEYNSKQK